MDHGGQANQHFIDMFNNFFKKGVMAGTYKAVFLHALTDLGRHGQDNLMGGEWIRIEGDKLHLDLNFIAIRLAKYYWDMEVAFKMRHTPKRMVDHNNPDADIDIITIIREETERIIKQRVIDDMGGISSDGTDIHSKIKHNTASIPEPQPPTLEDLASEDMVNFRKKVVDVAMKEVLQNLPNDMPSLYTKDRGKNYLVFDRYIVEFMKNYAPMIKKALNYMLAIHLEKNNPKARHIATKIDNETDFHRRMDVVRRLEAQIGPTSASAAGTAKGGDQGTIKPQKSLCLEKN